MSGAWPDVAAAFHERVRAACWDSLAGQLLKLHQPHIYEDTPVCRGCDRDRADVPDLDPVWPCRTYTELAATLLNVRNVEETLRDLLIIAERRSVSHRRSAPAKSPPLHG